MRQGKKLVIAPSAAFLKKACSMTLELDQAPRSPRRITRVAIVGGGFSGTIQAINLLRHDGPAAVLIERRPRAGRGIAYSSLSDEHVLNVRASNMSAFPDDTTHF